MDVHKTASCCQNKWLNSATNYTVKDVLINRWNGILQWSVAYLYLIAARWVWTSLAFSRSHIQYGAWYSTHDHENKAHYEIIPHQVVLPTTTNECQHCHDYRNAVIDTVYIVIRQNDHVICYQTGINNKSWTGWEYQTVASLQTY